MRCHGHKRHYMFVILWKKPLRYKNIEINAEERRQSTSRPPFLDLAMRKINLRRLDVIAMKYTTCL